jgi:DNA end-binding protein Ku
MSAKSVGRVVISLGLAQFAVKLYNATGSESVSFNMINPATNNRVGQKLIDKVTGQEVLRGDCVKGYEYAKDQFVIFTDEEIANMQAAKKDTIEISEFVPVSEISPLQVEKVYYTAPDKGMDKGYRLWYELLKKKERAAIGTYVARGKEHLVAIQAHEHGLIMYQLFYNTEIRSFDNKCANVPVSAIEIAMGSVLLDTLSKPKFDSSRYSDKFIEKVTAAVTAKLENPTAKIESVSSSVTVVEMAETIRSSLLSMGVPKEQIDEMVAKAMAEAGDTADQKPEPLALTPVAKPKKTRAKKAS